MNTKSILLSEEIADKAEARARALGMTLTEYVQALVNQDSRTKEYDPWREPIPKEVDEQWEKDIAEFCEQEKIKPRPRAKTVAEFRKLLEEEAAQLAGDEGD